VQRCKTSNEDRRNLIIRCSDEKKGDTEYFDTMYKYLDDINVIRTCYDYFKSIEGVDKFRDIPIPQTEYQNNLKELSKSPIEQWLESFTREHITEERVELLGTEVYELFKNWCFNNNVKYDISCVKLGVRLINMNISGVEKGNHTKRGDTKMFIIPCLVEYFNIGCLIDL